MLISIADVVDSLAYETRDRALRAAPGLADSVSIVEATDRRFSADVGRQARHRVRLAWGAGPFMHSCTCLMWKKRKPCEHIWAALIVAVAAKYYDDDGALADILPGLKLERLAERFKKPPPDWRTAFGGLRRLLDAHGDGGRRGIEPSESQITYTVDLTETGDGQGVSLHTAVRTRKVDGDWSKPKPFSIGTGTAEQLSNPLDRVLVSMIAGARTASYGWYYSGGNSQHRLNNALATTILPMACREGRCFVRMPSADEASPVTWREGKPWQFRMRLVADPATQQYRLEGQFHSNGQTLPVSEPPILTSGGMLFWPDRIEPMDDAGAFAWIVFLRHNPDLVVPMGEWGDLAKMLYEIPSAPPFDMPEELRLDEVQEQPVARLKIRMPKRDEDPSGERLVGELGFRYGQQDVAWNDPVSRLLRMEFRQVVRRSDSAEGVALDLLRKTGFRLERYYSSTEQWRLPRAKLAKAVMTLTRAGWQVEAEGKLYRQPGDMKLSVTSEIDWFDLNGSVNFEGQVVKLPQLLAALRKGDNVVQLGDGSMGMLPEDWLKKYGLLVNAGQVEGDKLRFTRTQTGLLDALLAAEPQATCDETFARVRQELRNFDGIAPVDPPATFQGQLRPYQRDGLGWLNFLRRFSFGGCLADDMGLGKTVQVLAMLEGRKWGSGNAEGRRQNAEGGMQKAEVRMQKAEGGMQNAEGGMQNAEGRSQETAIATVESDGATLDAEPASLRSAVKDHSPSLVVVPRSLVFNWVEEARRFAPGLRVVDHSHSARQRGTEHLKDYDLVLTTYGTLRRDAAYLKDFVFDYVILDEAQAIKNGASESAKAARLLKGHHRLALSGTPIQNHLGDLWSLFEFLNPGMLGTSAVFSSASSSLRNPDDDTRTLLSKALRPFILRRTKNQVARDLPERLEQTIHCELEPAQRKLYNELRDHYRASLLQSVAAQGMNKSKIQILEALLRLRQCACHPALIDKSRTKDASAKLDILLSRLVELVDEGHKVLVFSQFTSFLALVRQALGKKKVVYEYLDGQTTDRQARVDRFQTDPECRTFLISLKAGGLGLNLTAADYVFLLDPWWNPAIEAQAIDRAHRIGQTKQVFAFRLIAKDTVEEKVLQLQEQKRALADAIISADESLLRSLDREDLEMLLS